MANKNYSKGDYIFDKKANTLYIIVDYNRLKVVFGECKLLSLNKWGHIPISIQTFLYNPNYTLIKKNSKEVIIIKALYS